jgi:hypothetical protein
MDNDFCTPDGARRLKQRIEDYWRDKGYKVDVKLVEAGFVPAMRSARFDVRSDLVNGFPRSNTVEANHSGAQRRDFAGVDSD